MQADGAAAAMRSNDNAPRSETIPGLVWAFRIHSDGAAEPLPIESDIDLNPEGLLWLHLNLADQRALQWLSAYEDLAPAAAISLLQTHNAYQQLQTSDDCVYGVISDLVRAIGQSTEDTAHFYFVMTDHLLISGRHHPLSAVDSTRRALEGGYRVNNAAELLETIVEHLAEAMDNVGDRIGDSLDDLEELMFSDQDADLRQKLGNIRRTCVRLHRQLSGLRVIFHRLERDGVESLKPALRLRAGKLAQRLDDLDHSIVEMRDRARLLQEELHLKIEEQTNNNLRVLSVLTALLLPPTLITGIFGMNTKGLPLTDVETGFLWAAAMLVSSVIGAYLVMKRIGVIK